MNTPMLIGVAAIGSVLLGLLLGYAWWVGQGMPHAASAQGMKVWEGALIFGPVVAGAVLAGWGWRRLRRP